MARKLKKFVIPSIIGTLAITTGSLAAIYNVNDNVTDDNRNYTVSEISEENFPVINEVEEKKPMKPFVEDSVGMLKDYYQKSDDEETQKKSLFYYEKTYMPSTGIMYSSDESFDVVSAMDGVVKEIGEDNILGKYVIIEHSNGYKTTYYSLKETSVTKGSNVVKGDVIGISGTNKIEETLNYNVLFETYHDGYLMDPEDFYNVDFNNIN